MSTQESALQPAIAPETPVVAPPAAPPAPAAPAIPETRRDTIARAVAESKQNPREVRPNPRPRFVDGKFAPVEAAPVAPAFPTAETQAPKPPSMPKSLRLELQPHWEKTPAELQAAINQREADYERGVQPLKEKAKLADEISNEFKPYEHMLRAEGGTPQLAIRELLKTAAIFRSGNPGLKVQAVAQIMQQFGIPLEHLQQVFSGTAPIQPAPARDPQISQLTQQVEQLTQAQQRREEMRAQSVVREFAAKPEHKHFDAVSGHIIQLLAAPQLMGATDDMSESEKLKLAYDTAIRLDPAVHQMVLAEQQSRDQAQNRVAQAKSAAVQIKGAPTAAPGSKPDPKNRREIIKNAMHANR